MVSSSALERLISQGLDKGSVRCQQIWGQSWQSQLADIILVQCGQMVSSSALEPLISDSVRCQQIWGQSWQSQRANIILVQREQKVSSSALDATDMGSARCQ